METEWLSEILTLAKVAGPFGTVLMGMLWWLERRERREALTAATRAIVALEAGNATTAAVAASMENRNRAIEALAHQVNLLTVHVENLLRRA